MYYLLYSILLLFVQYKTIYSSVTEDNCEVCVKFINKLSESIPADDRSNQDKLEKYFKEKCSKAQGKDERLCYYIGGLKTSATYIVNELTQPLSWGMPAEKVCERLKKNDPQICDLKYEKLVDLATAKLKKLKVKELKQILENWGEQCLGCTEKSDFIKMVEDKMSTHDPKAFAARQKIDL